MISIHALREEGDGRHDHQGDRMEISIHALREEGDATARRWPRGNRISIHALREEGDYLLDLLSRMTNEFLSTPSARRATGELQDDEGDGEFLSTPSARRATRAA